MILVTGGTGTLGREVVPLLRQEGHDVRILSRRQGPEYVTGDLATGAGLTEALDGVRTVVHLGGSAKGDGLKARNLVDAATGLEHLVYVSVVGADRLPVVSRTDRAMFGYFAAKREAELVIENSGLPWTTLRATQFNESMLAVVKQMTKLPVVPVAAGFRFQPVDAAAVAHQLTELALAKPAGLVPDIAGPEVYEMKTLVRSYLTATGKHRLILPIRMPGKAARAYRAGANLAPGTAEGRSWAEFLSQGATAAV